MNVSMYIYKTLYVFITYHCFFSTILYLKVFDLKKFFESKVFPQVLFSDIFIGDTVSGPCISANIIFWLLVKAILEQGVSNPLSRHQDEPLGSLIISHPSRLGTREDSAHVFSSPSAPRRTERLGTVAWLLSPSPWGSESLHTRLSLGSTRFLA